MGFIANIEKTLERKVNGLFSKAFKSALEPVEIAAGIRHEMDSKASVISRERILVPNHYLVKLSPQDYERFKGLGQPLIDELISLAEAHSKKQRFSFGEVLAIELTSDPSLVVGQLDVSSEGRNLEVQWIPVLEVSGKALDIKGARATVGRDSSADIQIDDNGLSRKHFEILWDGKNAIVRDLKSTNGTKVAGRKIDQAALSNETVISAGRTNFVFKVIARAK